MISREMRVGNFFREFAVIGFVIIPADALLGHAGGAAGFENVERFSFERGWNPNFRLEIAQPFILEMRKAQDIVEAFNFARGIPARLLRPIEPEWAAGFG